MDTSFILKLISDIEKGLNPVEGSRSASDMSFTGNEFRQGAEEVWKKYGLKF